MLMKEVAHVGLVPVILTDSVTKLTASHSGAIAVTGSHGGSSSAEFALAVPLRAVIFNDAGIGKDRAGVVALDLLQRRGIASIAVSHTSSRIGDAADMWANGEVSCLNDVAIQMGAKRGQKLQDAVQHFGDEPVQTLGGLG